MSDQRDQDLDETLAAELQDAADEFGLLIPQTLDEVEAFERQLEEEDALQAAEIEPRISATELASESRQQREPTPTSNVVRLPWVSSTVGFVVGAAAATLLWVSQKPPVDGPLVGSGPGELTSSPSAEPAPTSLTLSDSCSDSCCAGSACPSAAGSELASCASGRSCVACDLGAADGARSVYKVRLSSIALNDPGREWLNQQGLALQNLQLCVSAQGKDLGCRSALEAPDDLLQWSSLPTATTRSQLVGGFRLRLVQGSKTVASWSAPIQVSAETLCRGIAAKPSVDDGTVIGRVSAFFDETNFVELARSEDVTELVAQQARYQAEGPGAPRPKIYETTKDGNERFALVLGPLTAEQAESLRWSLLEQKQPVTLSFGDDYRGRPRD